jgi:alkyl hydroperoxide reductase subunit AhpC
MVKSEATGIIAIPLDDGYAYLLKQKSPLFLLGKLGATVLGNVQTKIITDVRYSLSDALTIISEAEAEFEGDHRVPLASKKRFMIATAQAVEDALATDDALARPSLNEIRMKYALPVVNRETQKIEIPVNKSPRKCRLIPELYPDLAPPIGRPVLN